MTALMHDLARIVDEWRKGCTVAGPSSLHSAPDPAGCDPCTRAAEDAALRAVFRHKVIDPSPHVPGYAFVDGHVYEFNRRKK